MFQVRNLRNIVYVTLGFLIRLLVLKAFKEPLGARVEISTPISSWRRTQEAVYLWNSGMNPYLGDIFHEYPISLQLYKILINHFNLDVTFAALDVVIAILLKQSTYTQLINSKISNEIASSRSRKVFLIYLFSPITIVSCAGMSTAIFTNLLIATIGFILPSKPFRSLTCVFCALLACNNLHFSTLIIPVFLCLEYCSNERRPTITKDHSKPSYYLNREFKESLKTSTMFCVAALITLISASHFLMGNSWTFLKSTYLFVLKIEDLTPNIGMLWYLMTEMFEQFLDFFICIAQINAFIHVIPLSIWLRDSPFLALYSTLITTTITQPYPSLANIGLITSLIPQWAHLIPHMSKKLLVICASVTCACLWVVFWNLWIVMGTANANFYFGATLAFSMSLILFLVDLLRSHGYLEAKMKFDTIAQDKTEVPLT